jgi:hypothetical protein
LQFNHIRNLAKETISTVRETQERDDRCLSPNYEARVAHTGLHSRRHYNRTSLWSRHLHNDGKWQRVIRLLRFPTTVTGIQRRQITGGLDLVRGLKKKEGKWSQKKDI